MRRIGRIQNALDGIFIFGAALLVGIPACSSSEKAGRIAPPMASTQETPTLTAARVSPDAVRLDEALQPDRRVRIVAEAGELGSQVREVRLRFLKIPFQVDLHPISGTLWSATLSPEQIQRLAVGGETVSHPAKIIATTHDGRVIQFPRPLFITIQSPKLSQNLEPVRNQAKSSSK